jgi:hypothetical protein
MRDGRTQVEVTGRATDAIPRSERLGLEVFGAGMRRGWRAGPW